MPKSGLSTAIIFKSSVVGPGVPTGTPGVCWTAGRGGEADCCCSGLLRDSAAVGQICAQRARTATANRAKKTIVKRRYVFISILPANNYAVGQILALLGQRRQQAQQHASYPGVKDHCAGKEPRNVGDGTDHSLRGKHMLAERTTVGQCREIAHSKTANDRERNGDKVESVKR